LKSLSLDLNHHETAISISHDIELGEENIHDWYSKFKVKHYYAIYVEIK
jgi:hypothetical protein